MKSATIAVTAAALSMPTQAQVTPPPGSPPVVPIKPSKIILVGDSTIAVMGGWGPSFCAYHVTSFAACLNLARGGRSSGNYRWEGSWAVALSEMHARGYQNVWVLIQFGHNDQPGKPGRSTDFKTGYPENLRRYVRETRAAGAIPILVTPLTRRVFKDGKLVRDLEPWAEATRAVAVEMNVPLLDLNRDSGRLIEALGSDYADRFAQVPKGTAAAMPAPATPAAAEVQVQPMATPKLSFDYTHLGTEGANVFASVVTRELSEAVPAMRPLLLP
jgi:lysophospholipase L1-like esterase